MLVAMYLCILVLAGCVPFFIKWGWPELTKKSLYIKTVCSAMFVLFSVFGMLLVNKGLALEYQRKIFIGLCLGFVGDVLLTTEPFFKNNKTANGVASILGGVAFLAGHIFYIVSFFKEMSLFGLSVGPLFWCTFAITLAIVISLKFILNVKLGKLAVPVLVYAIMIDVMFSSALTLGIGCGKLLLVFLLGGGALLFVVSDLNLALKIFDGKRFHTLPNRCIYIITYYIAQILIASTVLFF